MRCFYIAIMLALLLILKSNIAISQINYSISEDKVIHWGGHISPFNFSTRGISVGVGASKPIAPRIMGYLTVGAITASYLELELSKAFGVQLKPAVLYFPGIIDNYKGMVVGLEMPVYMIGINRNIWARKTTTGDLETFEYLEFNRVQARSFQAGLGAVFGLRTHRRNQTFFWQPTLSFGVIYKNLSRYQEVNVRDDFFRNNETDRIWLSQNKGLAPYVNLEIIYGLYKYRKKGVKMMEL